MLHVIEAIRSQKENTMHCSISARTQSTPSSQGSMKHVSHIFAIVMLLAASGRADLRAGLAQSDQSTRLDAYREKY
jgi:hypothetical protein